MKILKSDLADSLSKILATNTLKYQFALNMINYYIVRLLFKSNLLLMFDYFPKDKSRS